MSSTSERGPGRPPLKSDATLEKQRRVRDSVKLGIPRATIAAVEKCSVAYVGILNGEAIDGDAADPAAESEVPQPHKLSPRVAQSRASEYAEEFLISKLGLAVDAFWTRLVVAIHKEGDGFRLGIGEPGCRFKTRDDLRDLFGRREVKIDEWIAMLVESERLKKIGNLDIGIPHGMGLTPAENLRVKRSAKRAVRPAPNGQTEMLHVVPADGPDATEIPPQTQIISELNLRPDTTETPGDANLITGIFPAAEVAHAATATAYAKDSSTLAAAVASDSRVGDATETRIKFASGATETPLPTAPDATEIIPQRSPLADLTAELVALAGIKRAANAEDLGQVTAWTEQGFTADTMRGVIQIKRAQINGKTIAGLKYFDGAMQDTRRAKVLNKVEPAQAATPPPEPDEPITGTDQPAQWARVQRGLGKGISKNWLGKAKIGEIDEDGKLTIVLPTLFIRDHVAKHHQVALANLWHDQNPEVQGINLEVAGAEPRPDTS